MVEVTSRHQARKTKTLHIEDSPWPSSAHAQSSTKSKMCLFFPAHPITLPKSMHVVVALKFGTTPSIVLLKWNDIGVKSPWQTSA